MSFRRGERVHYSGESEVGKIIGPGYSPELDEFGNEIKDNHGKVVTFDTGYIKVGFGPKVIRVDKNNNVREDYDRVHWCNPDNLIKAVPGV